MVFLAKTTMPLLFLTVWWVFNVVCGGDATTESLPPHGSHHHHPAMAPSPHHHHHHHHYHHHHPTSPSPSPHHYYHHPTSPSPSHPPSPHHYKSSPAPSPHHYHPHPHSPAPTPVHPPPYHTPVTPVHPPTHSPLPPVHAPVKPPVYHFPRSFVAVQGVVYCKSCKYPGVDTLLGASPLSGATVKLECNNTRYPIIVETKSDKNGYFYVEAPKTVTNYGAHKCKVFLVRAPNTACGKITNLNGGLNGGVLKPKKTFVANKLSFVLYSVGPFAFEPKCPR